MSTHTQLGRPVDTLAAVLAERCTEPRRPVYSGKRNWQVEVPVEWRCMNLGTDSHGCSRVLLGENLIQSEVVVEVALPKLVRLVELILVALEHIDTGTVWLLAGTAQAKAAQNTARIAENTVERLSNVAQDSSLLDKSHGGSCDPRIGQCFVLKSRPIWRVASAGFVGSRYCE